LEAAIEIEPMNKGFAEMGDWFRDVFIGLETCIKGNKNRAFST